MLIASCLAAFVIAAGCLAWQWVRWSSSFRQVSIMTPNEQEFFGRLVRAAPGLLVFPQVAMSALIEPVAQYSQHAKRNAWRAIGGKRVDFAVYTKDLDLLCVVELDDRTHDVKQDKARDRVLATAGIVTVRWRSDRKPPVHTIRNTFEDLRRRRRIATDAAD